MGKCVALELEGYGVSGGRAVTALGERASSRALELGV